MANERAALRGDRLIKLRNERGKRQYEAAFEMGFSQSYLSSLEREQTVSPGAQSIAIIAKYYGVHADYLTGITSDRRPYVDRMSEAMISPAEQDIITAYRKLPPSLRVYALEMIQSLLRSQAAHAASPEDDASPSAPPQGPRVKR